MAFMDKFLFFWTHYNTQIVQGVIAIILLMVTFLVWGALISPKTSGHEDAESAGRAAGSTEEIEKMLKKLMEDQAGRPAMLEGAGASIDPASLDAAVAAQVETYKKGIAEKEALIKQLEVKVQEAEKAAASAPAADAGNSAELEGKVKNLEARLQEYEIIAEDISDLAKFKDENAKLTKELEALKAAKAAAPAAPAPEPAAAPAPAAAAAPTPAPAAPAPEPAAAAPAEAAAEPAAAAPAAAEGDFSIDDELMKEFAAAVEGQKSGSLTEEKAPQAVTNEEGELIDKFGEFVAKKN